MSEVAIKFEKVSKQYRLGEIGTGTLSHDINRWWYKVRGKEDPYLQIGAINKRDEKSDSDYVWALKDIDLEIKKGEVLGIIGKNGAGKSTLLKILSKVTRPTSGVIKAKGRIASLLEVGTGFHQEMTGRENIYLNGSIMGMSKREIQRKFDEIVDFSGVERYIDTPVKRYSSGMIVRLGFAIAAHLDPEILVVDEVLAVGDAEFQKKALGKIDEVAKGEGRTVLFVSHSMTTISTLTQNCILLKNGILFKYGKTDEVINTYLSTGSEIKSFYNDVIKKIPTIKKVEIITSLPNNYQENGKEFLIEINVNMPRFETGIAVAIQIKSFTNAGIIHMSAFDTEKQICRKIGENKIIFRIPNIRAYMGKYVIDVHLAQISNSVKYDYVSNVCPFDIVILNKSHKYKWQKDVCAYIEDYSYYSE